MCDVSSDLLIITGPPGSGKSTVSALVAQRFERCALVQGDVFFGFVVGSYIDPWLPESHEQNVVVTMASATAAGRYAKGGYMTVFDGMVGPWFLQTFMEYCDLDSVHYAILMPSVETCVERVLAREDHGFRDEPATRDMYGAFLEADVDAKYIVADVSDGPSAGATEVLSRFHGGVLAYPSDLLAGGTPGDS
jgi:cytidylate kinase